jgi:hypothetical protein
MPGLVSYAPVARKPSLITAWARHWRETLGGSSNSFAQVKVTLVGSSKSFDRGKVTLEKRANRSFGHARRGPAGGWATYEGAVSAIRDGNRLFVGESRISGEQVEGQMTIDPRCAGLSY